MKIVVLGAGGVGGYFGARLAETGCDVTFVARGAHLAAMRHSGLQIKSPRGDVTISPVQAVEKISDVESADLIIVGVKLWDTASVAPTLRPLVDKGAAVISLQNGVQKDDMLRQYLPARAILGGVCFISATISAPGVITHAAPMARLVFGEFGAQSNVHTKTFLDACLKAGIDAEISTSIERAIWEKFVFIVGVSATTATMRQPIGVVRSLPESRAFLLDVMREVVAVGRARGVDLAPDFAENRLAFCDGLPASMDSSMHHDLRSGNRLEVPWLSGGVVELGDGAGVPTPLNRAVVAVLAPYAGGAR